MWCGCSVPTAEWLNSSAVSIVQLVSHEMDECVLCHEGWRSALPKWLWGGLVVFLNINLYVSIINSVLLQMLCMLHACCLQLLDDDDRLSLCSGRNSTALSIASSAVSVQLWTSACLSAEPSPVIACLLLNALFVTVSVKQNNLRQLWSPDSLDVFHA